jgi:hypothetical protein
MWEQFQKQQTSRGAQEHLPRAAQSVRNIAEQSGNASAVRAGYQGYGGKMVVEGPEKSQEGDRSIVKIRTVSEGTGEG